MGVFSRIFRARDKPRGVKDSTPGAGYRLFLGKSTAGNYINERTSMQVAAVYACIRVLSEGVAQLPVHLYHRTDDGRKVKATDHSLYKIICAEPNKEMTQYTFVETLMTHLLIWGNAYAQIIRNGRGEVIALYPLMANRMKVDRDNDGNLYYQYTLIESEESKDVKNVQEKKLRMSPHDVLHIPGLGFDGLIGYSPLATAKNSIGLMLACEDYGSNFFANGATPGGVLEHPGVLKDPARVRENWTESFSGSNAHKVAVLEEGMKYTPLSISPNEAQFLDTRKFQLDEIARIFRVPPHLIGDLDHSTFSNIEQQSLEFVTYTLQPWLIRWEQGLNRALLSDDEKGDYFVKFSVDGLLRGDYASRMSGYATARQNGWMSSNDIRRLEDMDMIPDEDGGNLYLVNGSMTKLADAGAFANKNNTSAEQSSSTESEPSEPEEDPGQGGTGTPEPEPAPEERSGVRKKGVR